MCIIYIYYVYIHIHIHIHIYIYIHIHILYTYYTIHMYNTQITILHGYSQQGKQGAMLCNTHESSKHWTRVCECRDHWATNGFGRWPRHLQWALGPGHRFASVEKEGLRNMSVFCCYHMGVSIVMGVPLNGLFIMKHPSKIWMIWGYPYFR